MAHSEVLASVVRHDAAPAGAHTVGDRSFSTHSRTSPLEASLDRKSTRLNSSHGYISYAVFCLKKKKINQMYQTHAGLSRPSRSCNVSSRCSKETSRHTGVMSRIPKVILVRSKAMIYTCLNRQ